MDDVTFGCSGPMGDAWLVALRYRGGVWCLWMPCWWCEGKIFANFEFPVVIHYHILAHFPFLLNRHPPHFVYRWPAHISHHGINVRHSLSLLLHPRVQRGNVLRHVCVSVSLSVCLFVCPVSVLNVDNLELGTSSSQFLGQDKQDKTRQDKRLLKLWQPRSWIGKI